MAFQRSRNPPQFADLKGILAQTKKTDDALYQVVSEIIERLTQFKDFTRDEIDITKNTIITNISNILPGELTPEAHAPTHEPGGTDPLTVDAIPTVGSLRTLGPGANQAAPGNDSRFTDPSPPLAHAPTHKSGGSDPLDVRTLPGFPGTATTFLSGAAAFTTIPSGTGAFTVISNSTTGTVNDWVPGLVGNTLIDWIASASLVITGIAGGVVGQIVTIKSSSSGVIYLSHADVASAVGNRLKNVVTVKYTPIYQNGYASYIYAGTNGWELIGHDQGRWLALPYSASNFTGSGSMTWTVESGDHSTYLYAVIGGLFMVHLTLLSTSIGGTPSSALQVALPGNFLPAFNTDAIGFGQDNGVGIPVRVRILAGDNIARFYRIDAANWAANVNNTSLSVQFAYQL